MLGLIVTIWPISGNKVTITLIKLEHTLLSLYTKKNWANSSTEITNGHEIYVNRYIGFAKDYYTIVFGFAKQATIILTDACILTFCLYVRTNFMTANKLQIEWLGIY